MIRLSVVTLLVTITFSAGADTSPTSAPATTQRARYEIITPPGFQRLTIGDHSVIAEPADLPWIQEALKGFEPTSRPTTMPSTLVASRKETRPQIEQAMAADLGITDPKATGELFDQILIPNLQRLGNLKPPLFFLVTTREKLKNLLMNGWTDPRLHYNKLTGDVQFVPRLELSMDREMDEYLVPSIYPATALPDQRKQMLSQIVDRTEQGLAGTISGRAQGFVHTATMDFIGRTIFAPLKLRPDQEWFSMGVSSTLAAKYLAMVEKIDFKQLIARMTRENPTNPISPRTIDLAHPVDPKDLRREAMPLYVDAMGKKAMVVAGKIIEQGGPDAIKKILAAMRKQMPKDGDELVKLIKDASGVDVSEDVKAK
jgi:hypothetical protein